MLSLAVVIAQVQQQKVYDIKYGMFKVFALKCMLRYEKRPVKVI